MSEQWLGLHNQDDHEWGWGERDAWCTTCEGPRRDRGQCLAKKPCRCCLAAEVEVLREQITCDGVRCAKCEGVPAEIGGLGVLDCYHCVVRERDALAVDVEALRRIRESQIEDIIALRYDLEVAREAQATIDALKAQVQRVREMHTIDQCPRCAEFHCLECGCEGVYTEQVSCRTTRVLDGGESDE